jgi:enoyl-CoA hydratase/carnithine racemase
MASEAGRKMETLYSGAHNYVTLTRVHHHGRFGVLLYYANPDPRKLHAVDERGMLELFQAVATVEEQAVLPAESGGLSFLVLYGAYDAVHAGADITEFAGEPDYERLRAHMYRGVELDARIKALWPRLRTVGVLCGNRFGGSVEWPLFAQYGVADTATTLQLSEVTLGILPGWDGILNVMFRSGSDNALYMAATGNPVSGTQLLETGLVHALVESDSAPDRQLSAPEAYAVAWQAHAERSQQRLLDAALQLATAQSTAAAGATPALSTPEDLEAELARRTAVEPYQTLRDHILLQVEGIAPDQQEAELKRLGKLAMSELGNLGKPLAPNAVEAISGFVEQYRELSAAELTERTLELGRHEADLCIELMRHDNRRVGVNAVLSKDPVAKVPVFT